ncbi:MAG TPA: dihydropteroate synthase [Syntrophomonadaceae bacterium]|nr:dihydropteroate synthase [Syntrophomonadaceae bacterium]
MSGHHAVLIDNLREAQDFIKLIGSDDKAFGYMGPKAIHRIIKLKNIRSLAANIIKQEILSKGGEAAVSKSALFAEGYTDVLLMGTIKQYRELNKKLKLQPFGLKKIASEIDAIIRNLEKKAYTMVLANGQTMEIGQGTLIMGILNVTPDSFSDGGQFFDTDLAIDRAKQMIADGADIIDIGGASSRPDALIADGETELKRILPVVQALAREDTIISIDTFRGSVAQAALEAGAHMINDIGSLQLDPSLLSVLIDRKSPVVLMHNRLQIRRGEAYGDLISDIITELRESIDRALEGGLGENQIIIDPGIGFGKTAQENRIIIKRLREFKGMGYPILLGASRKSFIGHTLGVGVKESLEASLAVAGIGIMNGANIIRVHDVRASKQIALMTDAVVNEDG